MEPHTCRCSGAVCMWLETHMAKWSFICHLCKNVPSVYARRFKSDNTCNEEYRSEIFTSSTNEYRLQLHCLLLVFRFHRLIYSCFYSYIFTIKATCIPFLKLLVLCQAYDLAPFYLRSTLRRRKYSLPIWLCKSVLASFPCNIWKLELCKFLCNEGCTKLEHRT